MGTVLWLAGGAWAATWVVDQSGKGDVTTLDEVRDLASDGDTVLIRAGTYRGEKLTIAATGVTIEGDGALVTTLDGEGVTASGIGMVEGNTVRGLAFKNHYTAAIEFTTSVDHPGSTPTIIEDCVFANDPKWVEAGGSWSFTSIWVHDTADEQAIIVRDSVFINAEFVWYHFYPYTLSVENSVFVNSKVRWIGYADYTELVGCADYDFHHNLFMRSWFETAPPFPDRDKCDGVMSLNATNNIFVGPLDYPFRIYQGYEGLIAGNLYTADVAEPEGRSMDGAGSHAVVYGDNLVDEPLFVDWTDDDDWTNDDLRLLPTSPGIDLGVLGYASVETDLLGLDRVLDGDGDGVALPDAGPYELDPDATVGDTGGAGDGGADTGATGDGGSVDTAGDGGAPEDGGASEDGGAAGDGGGAGDGGAPVGGDDDRREGGCKACDGGGAAWTLLLLPFGLRRRRAAGAPGEPRQARSAPEHGG